MANLTHSDPAVSRATAGEVLLAFLSLGCTSFGGPVAHIAYFREAFVVRRRWLSETAYADLVALCQALPGPASSQVGMGIGLAKAGLVGAGAAWLGFTLPSAFLMTLFGFAVARSGDVIPSGALHGLKLAALAVVAQAVVAMARDLCPDWPRRVLALVAAGAALSVPAAGTQIAILVASGAFGAALLSPGPLPPVQALAPPASRRRSAALLALFAILLLGLPVLAHAYPDRWIELVDSFYRAGGLVFGGGHVVLPLLHEGVVATGWTTNDVFLAGYGAAQAMPGPLFTFSAFLGAAIMAPPYGIVGALVCLLAIFAPSLLLVSGALPFWDRARAIVPLRRALLGVNAGVVGLLSAALVDPVAVSALTGPWDVLAALIALAALASRRVPAWAVVIASATIGAVLMV